MQSPLRKCFSIHNSARAIIKPPVNAVLEHKFCEAKNRKEAKFPCLYSGRFIHFQNAAQLARNKWFTSTMTNLWEVWLCHRKLLKDRKWKKHRMKQHSFWIIHSVKSQSDDECCSVGSPRSSHRIGWENDMQTVATMDPSPITIELRANKFRWN